MTARKSVPAPTVNGSESVVDALAPAEPTPGVIRLLSAAEAQRLTQRIKFAATSVRDGLFKLQNLVDEAKNSNAWKMLGFSSWPAYLVDTLGEEPMRVSRERRQELVGYLAGEGLSARAIAPIVGVSKSQVANDIAEVSSSGQVSELAGFPDPAPMFDVDQDKDPADPQAADPGATPAPDDAATAPEPPNSGAVAGLDGKTYPRQQPQGPRRASIVDDARNAGYQLRKVIDRLDRIRNDDRFVRNRAEILTAMQSHLDFARDVLNDFGVEGFLTNPTEQR